jgi:hypothetical protein
MHVQLSPENRDKVVQASGVSGVSVNRLVNLLIEAVDMMEVATVLRVRVQIPEATPPKKIYRHRKNWVQTF